MYLNIFVLARTGNPERLDKVLEAQWRTSHPCAIRRMGGAGGVEREPITRPAWTYAGWTGERLGYSFEHLYHAETAGVI